MRVKALELTIDNRGSMIGMDYCTTVSNSAYSAATNIMAAQYKTAENESSLVKAKTARRRLPPHLPRFHRSRRHPRRESSPRAHVHPHSTTAIPPLALGSHPGSQFKVCCRCRRRHRHSRHPGPLSRRGRARSAASVVTVATVILAPTATTAPAAAVPVVAVFVPGRRQVPWPVFFSTARGTTYCIGAAGGRGGRPGRRLGRSWARPHL